MEKININSKFTGNGLNIMPTPPKKHHRIIPLIIFFIIAIAIIFIFIIKRAPLDNEQAIIDEENALLERLDDFAEKNPVPLDEQANTINRLEGFNKTTNKK